MGNAKKAQVSNDQLWRIETPHLQEGKVKFTSSLLDKSLFILFNYDLNSYHTMLVRSTLWGTATNIHKFIYFLASHNVPTINIKSRPSWANDVMTKDVFPLPKWKNQRRIKIDTFTENAWSDPVFNQLVYKINPKYMFLIGFKADTLMTKTGAMAKKKGFIPILIRKLSAGRGWRNTPDDVNEIKREGIYVI